MNARAIAVFTLAGGLLVGGCASTTDYRASDSRAVYGNPVAQVDRVEYGTVESIEMFRDGQSGPINLGTILGGVAGGVIGHQIGSGRGNTAATIAGAIGGAVVGNELQKSQERDRYRVIVRLDSGATLGVPEVSEGELRVGDRVRVVNNRVYRV